MRKLKTTKDFVKGLADIIISAFFPLKCLACGMLIPLQGNAACWQNPETEESKKGHGSLQALFNSEMEPFLCPSCMDGFLPLTSPICLCCGKSFKSLEGTDRICKQCMNRKSNHKIGKTRSVGIYDSVFMALVRALKYNGKIQLARPFGRLLAKVYRANWSPQDIDMVIPVPLHRKRARARGFNQSWLMIKNWSDNNQSDGFPLIEPDLLTRIKWTQPQIGLSRSQREENIKGAFEAVHENQLESRRILLVDDVVTTGSTLDECAKTLLNAGARSVDALTLARAI